MKIISICTSKGGAGKTTTAVNLGFALAQLSKKILLIDVDKQGNLANYFNISSKKTLASFLQDPAGGLDIIKVRDNIDLINSGKQALADTEKTLVISRSPIKAMAKALSNLKQANNYDFIFLDLGPTLSLINENALYFSDAVLMPCSIGYFDLTGITQLLSVIDEISQEERPADPIKLNGILLNMYDSRTRLSAQIENALRIKYDGKVYNTRIRKNVAISEAPASNMTIQEYNANSYGAIDFNNLAKEFLQRA